MDKQVLHAFLDELLGLPQVEWNRVRHEIDVALSRKMRQATLDRDDVESLKQSVDAVLDRGY